MRRAKKELWEELLKTDYSLSKIPELNEEEKQQMQERILSMNKSNSKLSKLETFMFMHPVKFATVYTLVQTIVCLCIFQDKYVTFIMKILGGI